MGTQRGKHLYCVYGKYDINSGVNYLAWIRVPAPYNTARRPLTHQDRQFIRKQYLGFQNAYIAHWMLADDETEIESKLLEEFDSIETFLSLYSPPISTADTIARYNYLHGNTNYLTH